MIIECPNCKQRYNVMNSSRDEVVTCQSCKNRITLPEIKDGKEIKSTKTIIIHKDTTPSVQTGLINCPGCGKPVSPKAYSCPSCGYPIAEEFNKPKTVRIKIRMPEFLLKLSFKDKAGNILASGYDGDVVSFDVDNDTYIKGCGAGYGIFSNCFKVCGGKKYEAKKTGFWVSAIRINEVDVIDSE